MTLQDYVKQLGWNASQLAREAKIDVRTARRALAGEIILSENAQAIAGAISAALGRQILVGDIEELRYR